jgi:very-short-patch-repair endonuclease
MRIHVDECAIVDRIPLTSVARTLFDLAEVLDESHLERVWEEADRLNLLQMGEVEHVCRRNPGRRALRPIRRLMAEARAPTTTRSPLEDRFAAFCRDHRLPPPVTNVEILGCEVDAFWPKQRLIAELDGWEFHGHRAAFDRDHARDSARLVAGYRTIHVTHHRLDREASLLLAELRSLLGIHE